MNAVTVIVIGCLAVLVFDLLGAIVSRWLGFRYSRLAPGSYALYTATSVIAARVGPAWLGIVAGATVALVEATMGWGISWWIGPGRPPTSVSRARVFRVIVLVTCIGAGFGLVGVVVSVLMP